MHSGLSVHVLSSVGSSCTLLANLRSTALQSYRGQMLDLFYLKLSICKQTQPLFWSQVFGDLGAISFTIYKLGDGKHFNLLNGNS